ncbi:sterol desaturase family protein [Flectobacillus rivi]|jgi:sterol desaturase/sphingolipid hydroxylase (fatty acid hydroxylase superfamily)|uniref:Sterol desaturase family protein n=1 Tax=Flectobacillus rivi TaxID=2984209 RepID=A0ABT6Z6V7_9BACT|nr:sterol desaturase family protein [Flectobacillus rivi]MDI9876339.1 sterol desaturase family protein [Flectobacillus rivi]
MQSIFHSFQDLLHEFIIFLRLEGLLAVIHDGNWRAFKTVDGIFTLLMPLAPIIIVAEIFLLIITHQFNKKFYKIPFLIIIINRILEKVLKLSITIFFIALFKDYALFHLSLKWYFIPLGYLIYELNSFIRHYAAHKIRLLWCSHAVHHSATEITSSVTLTTAYLENIYTDIFAASFCTLMGLSPSLFFFVMILDSIWGAFVHVSEKALKNGRLGFLEKLILTPSHHRVHHASNDLYMDTNFCSIINIWDRLFGTYQEEKTYEPVKYGITRPMDANNFWDVYFGEYVALWNDVKNAKGINKIKYIFMPPGWHPNGEQQTAAILRQKAINRE